jgi:hypothetical protein
VPPPLGPSHPATGHAEYDAEDGVAGQTAASERDPEDEQLQPCTRIARDELGEERDEEHDHLRVGDPDEEALSKVAQPPPRTLALQDPLIRLVPRVPRTVTGRLFTSRESPDAQPPDRRLPALAAPVVAALLFWGTWGWFAVALVAAAVEFVTLQRSQRFSAPFWRSVGVTRRSTRERGIEIVYVISAACGVVLLIVSLLGLGDSASQRR